MIFGDELKKDRLTDDRITFLAVREVVQKQLLQSKEIKQAKLRCKVAGKFQCPLCDAIVPRITNAHTGETHAKILKRIMEQNPGASVPTLVRLDLAEHRKPGLQFIVCCASCNDRLEKQRVFLVEDIDAP